jgi:hypothetical protein
MRPYIVGESSLFTPPGDEEEGQGAAGSRNKFVFVLAAMLVLSLAVVVFRLGHRGRRTVVRSIENMARRPPFRLFPKHCP